MSDVTCFHPHSDQRINISGIKNIMFTHELVLGMCFSLLNRSLYIMHAEREQTGWKDPLERSLSISSLIVKFS